MASGSRTVVIIALCANGGIAVVKFVAALATGSGAMMAEAIHSAADCGNQGLLLFGGSRAQKPADDLHPLGYGREAYFWAFMVAVVLFTVGGLFSVFEGIHKLRDPHELQHAGWAIGVLLVSLAIETVSLVAALRAAAAARRGGSLVAWTRRTGDVDLLVVTWEDIAAEAGLLIALAAVSLTWATGDTRFDAAGSIGVGVVLLVVAVFIGAQMRRLIVGSAADPEAAVAVRRIWDEHGFDVLRAIIVWSGPGTMAVTLKVRHRDRKLDGDEMIRRMNAAEKVVRATVQGIGHQFVEPDLED